MSTLTEGTLDQLVGTQHINRVTYGQIHLTKRCSILA